MRTRIFRAPASVLAAFLLAVAGLLATPRTAMAATVDATISNLVVAPATGSPWRRLTTSFDWCVPDGSQPGDTFTVGLPGVLGGWPSSFPLTSSAGVVVASGTVNAGPPSYLTVTLGSAVAGQTNVCGTVSLDATARDGKAVAGTTKTVYVNSAGDLLQAEVSFDPISPDNTVPGATKEGWFTSEDQCRTTGTDCLNYAVYTVLGPDDADHTVVDTPPAGQQIDCTTVKGHWQDADGTWVRGFNADRWTINSCTTTSLSYTIHGVLDGLRGVVTFAVSVPPSGTGGTTYSNSATDTRDGGSPTTVTANVTSNRAIGTAIGSAIAVDKRDEAGNAADTPATAAQLPTGSTGIVITYTNNGLDPLGTVVVRDNTISGTGLVEDLTCDFSRAAAGAPTSGVVWQGPWPVGTTFTCTGTLTGVTPLGHYDLATVTAFDPTGAVVRGKDGYHATRPVVSIGDHVWWDNDRDGVQDGTEGPVAGVAVSLYDQDGGLVGVDTTDANGFYSFLGLPTSTDYHLRFTAPDGATWTRPVAGTDRALDSNASTTGQVAFTSPSSGTNSATSPDDPTLDAGLVRYDLTLAKTLVTKGPFTVGRTVTYTLTPRNVGPSTALAGWSITDVPGGRLVVTGMSGVGYTCSVATRTCTSSTPLAPGAGRPVTVTARIATGATGTLPNVAYVKPAASDVAEVVPLGAAPTASTNTVTSTTNNDARAALVVTVPVPRPVVRTWTYLVQADRYRVVVPGNGPATRSNARLVARLDDDGVLAYREDKGTNCQRRNAPTCLWYRTTSKVVTVKVTSATAPTPAQVMAAYDAVAPKGIGKVTTTARMRSVTRDTTVVWVLGQGATAAQPWGAKHTVPQVYLAHS